MNASNLIFQKLSFLAFFAKQTAEASENLALQMSFNLVLISLVTFVEVAPPFGGKMDVIKNFLIGMGIDFEEILEVLDT